MKVELNINARVWADYCNLLQDLKDECGCKGDVSKHLNNVLAELLLKHRMDRLIDAKLKEAVAAKGPRGLIELLVNGISDGAPDDVTQELRELDAQYREDV